MSGRTLRFVERRAQVGPPQRSVDVVVLDTWWTPGAGERPDVLALRPLIERVLVETDLVDGSLQRLDAWAAAAGLADRFVVDGATWWYRIRMAVRWELHELMIWLRVLAELAPPGRYETIEIPWRRTAFVAAAQAWAASRPVRWEAPLQAPHVVTRHKLGDLSQPYLRLRRFVGQTWRLRWAVRAIRGLDPIVATRRAKLRTRIDRLSADPTLVLAIAWAGAFHVVRGDGADRRMDPYLTLVLDRLAAEGSRVAMVVEGLDHQRPGDWRIIAGDERIIPQSMVYEQGRNAWDRGSAPTRVLPADGIEMTPLDLEGVDLAPAMKRVVDGYGGRWLGAQRWASRWAERFVREVRPTVIYLDREGTRTNWILAAHRGGVPVVAIQHGMIYANNPEYCHPAHRFDVRPDVTVVFGAAERAILLAPGGYAADKVVVTGSPRSDPEAMRQPASDDERVTVRRQLGVADGDRLLVVSVAHNPVMGDLYSATMAGRLLGGPLPGIHVVVKIHPQDRGQADYARLLTGLAAAGGYPSPAVTMVRDIDLYRLLRAADAHLGQYSTVLTDAVVAGTPNMIAVGQAHADPLGHVAAGVAVAVRSVDEVRAFMADPRPPTEAARAEFLRRHFEPGDAVGRIADVLLGAAAPGSAASS